MEELRSCFSALGFEDVRTYIQSGNVLFRGADVDETAIEEALAEQFGYPGRVVVMSHRRYAQALAAAPPAWGHGSDRRHNALFTLRGTRPGAVMGMLPPLSEFEEVGLAPGVIFWSGAKDRLTRTVFVSRLGSHPVYQELTVRNHNTVFRLATMLEEM